VLVKITRRSITRGDLQMIENDWGDARFPLVASHEMVGIVDRTGSRVTELDPGDRVGVGYQRIYGNYVGSRADMAGMLDFAAAHGIAVDVTVMPFSSLHEAIARVRSREVATGLVLESFDPAADGPIGAGRPSE
jgi:D-arabinose 1-dehydrogenase-like Zn-dependent alcohol dehydrogenase